MKPPLADSIVIDAVPCPYCEAAAGHRCRSTSGSSRPHDGRRKAAETARRAIAPIMVQEHSCDEYRGPIINPYGGTWSTRDPIRQRAWLNGYLRALICVLGVDGARDWLAREGTGPGLFITADGTIMS